VYVGSRQAEHESHKESMEEDDMVKSRVGNSLVQKTNQWGRKGCKPKGAYKEVPRPSQRLALAACQKIPYTFKIKPIYCTTGVKLEGSSRGAF